MSTILLLSSLKPGLYWVLCGLLGAEVLEPKVPVTSRHLLNVVLGPISLLYLLVYLASLRRNERCYCSACDEKISIRLESCPYCGQQARGLIAAPGEPDALDG